MHYRFPTIDTLEDVLPAISGYNEFIIADRGDHKIVNYKISNSNTFAIDANNPEYGYIRRECRGLIFDSKTEKILRRPLHKFFNVGECEETLPTNVDLTANHSIYDKLDGSMIAPFKINGGIRYGTKMGITDLTNPVEEFVAKNPHYDTFCEWCIDKHEITPIFEWISHNNPIVLEYKNDNLILIGMREMYSGKYIDINYFEEFNIPVVNKFNYDNKNVSGLIDYVSGLKNTEGIVISFDDGHKLKVKCDWYIRIHKILDKFRFDRNIADVILHGEFDDICSHLSDAQQDHIKEYERKFWYAFDVKLAELHDICNDVVEKYGNDRKAVALEYAPTLHEYDRNFVFKFMNGQTDVRGRMISFILSKTGSNKKYEMIHDWLGITS